MIRTSRFFLIVSLLLHSLVAFAGGRDPSFLLSKLLKPSAFEVSLSDLSDVDPVLRSLNGHLPALSDLRARFNTISKLPIEEIVAAPGHRLLRNPKQVDGLVNYISSSGGGSFVHDKLLLNVVIDANGKILSVDLWNAHHRMVAYMKAGYRTLGELSPSNLEILVNGRTVHGEEWVHHLPAAGVDLASMGKAYAAVAPGGEIRAGTIAVKGELTNYALGSRNTVGQLYKNTFSKAAPRIGVYFGTFDPIHEGHVSLLKYALKNYGFDEILVVPNRSTPHKPSASAWETRLKMTEIRLRNIEKINVYVGDSRLLFDEFGRDPFMEGITQTYGTRDIVQIIGEDSFAGVLKAGKLTPQSKQKFLVMRRPGATEKLEIPAELENLVRVSDYVDSTWLSSTQIRNKVKAGEPILASELDPEVRLYMELHDIYR